MLLPYWYAGFVETVILRWGYHPRGLARLLTLYKKPEIIRVEGSLVLFNPEIGPAYAQIVRGRWPRSEFGTHLFIKTLLREFSDSMTLIDVGACIGEYVLDLGVNVPNIARIYALEPNPHCCLVLRTSAVLNGLDNLVVEQVAAGQDSGIIEFIFEETPQMSGASMSTEKLHRNAQVKKIPVVTLDSVNISVEGLLVMLLDVEGYELKVLLGAQGLIAEHLPLIVFEYNHVSKRYFDIDEVRDLLGDRYRVFRITDEGGLSLDLANSHNCVAIPFDTRFSDVTQSLHGPWHE